MEATLIHPFDLQLKIESMSPKEITLQIEDQLLYSDGLIEIEGKLYLQTVRVPAVTKQIS